MGQIKRWLNALVSNPGMVSTALAEGRALAAPSAHRPDHRFQNLRARLAAKPDEIVRRTLQLIILRARAKFGSEQSLAILRSLPQLAPRRALAVEISFKAARFDPDFQRLAQAANAARDAGDWASGIVGYEQAVALYPLHRGYLVQLCHCYKESGAFEQAEIGYRDALALGAPLEDVWPHLEHAVHFGGGSMRVYPTDVLVDLEKKPDATLDLDLSYSQDVLSLAWLFLGETNFNSAWMKRMLRAAPRRTQIIEQFMNDPAFARANRPLLALVGRGDLA